ncbi:MAG: prefoldin subunit alpha [Candidatus Nanohalarchaeota archaeon]|nr:MAG: prefoldin subunit alpha [Candidatus Nanohaloarchaeota archaeon]
MVPAIDKNMQGKMRELETFKSQLQQYQQQKSQIVMAVQEMMSAKATIDGIRDTKDGEEMIIPIGGGTFIRGTITDAKNVVTSVGADVAVTKDAASAKKHIEEQIKSAEESVAKLDSEMQKIEMQAQNIYIEMEAGMAKK